MHTSFIDLVGTAVVPAHCLDTTELTDLTPSLEKASAIHDMAEHASMAAGSIAYGPCRHA